MSQNRSTFAFGFFDRFFHIECKNVGVGKFSVIPYFPDPYSTDVRGRIINKKSGLS